MAFYDTTWYCNFGNGTSTGYYAVPLRPQNTAVVAGQLCRQFTAPAVGGERVFICTIAGTTANTTDASWGGSPVRGATVVDGTATWRECTGASAVNGDAVNTPTWSQARAINTGVTTGAIIKRNNGASYQMCVLSLAMGISEPAFSDVAGVTTNEGAASWVCLGPVSNFTGGQAPHARLANACGATWYAAGNTVYVGDNHAESQTLAITISPSSGGVVSATGNIICHNHSGSYPPAASDLMIGATISTTAAANITFSPTGSMYVYGLTFKMGVGASSGATALALTPSTGSYNYFDNCSFWIVNTAVAASNIQIGGTGTANATVVFKNTTVKFGNIANKLAPGNGLFIWQNTGQVLASGSSIPNVGVFSFGVAAGSTYGTIVLEALDLSQINAPLNSFVGAHPGSMLIKDCKLNASMTVITPINAGFTFQFARCDSGAVSYGSSRYAYEGTETTETSITRVGGAVDPTGQAQTRKIVTTANSQWLRPFQAEPYAIWNTATGATVTVTVYGTINSASLPLTDEIWLECEYLGSSSQPLGSIISTTKATVLSTGTSVASDSSSWNGGGSGAGWSPFKLVATLSSPQPGMAGHIEARIRAAKASATYYIDPQPVLT